MKYHNHDNTDQATELLDSILNSSSEYGIIATDLTDRIILWNRGAEIIYGYTASEMLGGHAPQGLHRKESIDTNMLLMPENTFQSNITDYRMIALKKDGTTLPVSITVTSRVNQNNDTIGYLIIVKDITRIKFQEQFRNILIEIAHLINITTNVDDMCNSIVNIISKLLDVNIVYMCISDKFNNSCCINAQTGLCKDYHFLCCNLFQDSGPMQGDKTGCRLTYTQLTINSGPLQEHVISNCISNKLIRKDNASIIHIPLLSETALLGILHIILPTAQKEFLITETQILSLIANEITVGIQHMRLEEEIKQYANNLEIMVKERTHQLREKDAQLIQSGKLATLGEMATGIAHEINQPLGGISFITQGLLMAKRRGKLDDAMLDEKLNSMAEQIERINKIITHLRTFARQSGESKNEVNILEPLSGTFKLIGEQLKNKNITIIYEPPDNIPSVLADSNRLEQVFLNILGNARDALDDFEKTVRKIKNKENPPEWVETWTKKIIINVYTQDQLVVTEFIDNASGIPPSVLNKIFEPFFTTKEVGKGTGLGLSISYGIIKEFGGTIEVESKEMEGSKFIIKLPVYEK